MIHGFAARDRADKWKQLLLIPSQSPPLPSASPLALFEEQIDLKRVSTYPKIRQISQDVMRTRQDEGFYSSGFVKSILMQTLLKFCVHQSIDYMQGINELLAPILAISPQYIDYVEGRNSVATDSCDSTVMYVDESNQLCPLIHPFQLNMLFFERFVQRLLPTMFKCKGLAVLQLQLVAYHLLMNYHEPQLSMILRKEGLTPDMYVMPWLITLFARRHAIPVVLHLWDILLQVQSTSSPLLIIFLSVALMQKGRSFLIESYVKDCLTEALLSLKFETVDQVEEVVQQAMRLEESTPRCVLDHLQALIFGGGDDMEDRREAGLQSIWKMPCIITDYREVGSSLCSRPTGSRRLRYVLLDCRRQLSDKRPHIEGSISIQAAVQDEICILASQKSALLDRHDDTIAQEDSPRAPLDIQQVFSKAIYSLRSKTAVLLSLLWVAFVAKCPEEVHFVVVDDSTCSSFATHEDHHLLSDPLELSSFLNTAYGLPYHTSSSFSCSFSSREQVAVTSANLSEMIECIRTDREHLFISKDSSRPKQATGRSSSIDVGRALILLGFPRVSYMKSEQLETIDEDVSGDNCDPTRVFVDRPDPPMSDFFASHDVHTDDVSTNRVYYRRSALDSLILYLRQHGASTERLSAVNSQLAVREGGTDYLKEYQVVLFIHELKSNLLVNAVTIDANFYSNGSNSSNSSAVSPEAVHEDAITALRKFAWNPYTPPRGSRKLLSQQQQQQSKGEQPEVVSSSNNIMLAKLSCSLDLLHDLVSIMSAKKKDFLVSCIQQISFHSCIPCSPTDELKVSSDPTEAMYCDKLQRILHLKRQLCEVNKVQAKNRSLERVGSRLLTESRLLRNSMEALGDSSYELKDLLKTKLSR